MCGCERPGVGAPGRGCTRSGVRDGSVLYAQRWLPSPTAGGGARRCECNYCPCQILQTPHTWRLLGRQVEPRVAGRGRAAGPAVCCVTNADGNSAVGWEWSTATACGGSRVTRAGSDGGGWLTRDTAEGGELGFVVNVLRCWAAAPGVRVQW